MTIDPTASSGHVARALLLATGMVLFALNAGLSQTTPTAGAQVEPGSSGPIAAATMVVVTPAQSTAGVSIKTDAQKLAMFCALPANVADVRCATKPKN